jgi:2-C-methyl-D-erythritol 4-phosphate cytidylyltransferase
MGGKHRGESVSNGLEDLPPECQIVVIHDAARPLVTQETIGRVIDEARKGNGAVAGLPLSDTLKRVESSGRIIETVDRFGLWRAQTPQAFPREVITRAHREAREADRVATDDAALCEQIGLPVVVVRGSERALKITEENDFALTEALSIFRE